MKRTFLLPHWCKIAGWIIMVPLIFVCLVYVLGGYDISGAQGRLFYNTALWDTIYSLVDGRVGLLVTVLATSMLMTAFSRERDEDEYVASVRGRYLMLAFWIDFVFIVVTAFTVFDFDYLKIMALQMFLILFLHIVMFNVAMAVIRRKQSREE